jgi:solute carrier family 25 protein 38
LLFLGFYTGLLPTLARDLPFSGIYYMSYRKLKDIFSSDISKKILFQIISIQFQSDISSNKHWLTSQASISVVAGLIASFVTQPADVIKTYRQVAPGDYRNISMTIKSIIKV